MFNKIQNYLLLRHPLLWNTRVVVFSAIAIAFHIIFFIAGYIQGEINFNEPSNYYAYNSAEDSTIFFSVLVSIFSLIIWFVFYARNNGFKAFYPKQKFAVFKEWLIVFLIIALNVTYTLTFIYARDFRARNYFSYEELQRRCEVISQASVFMDGSYDESEIQYLYKDNVSYRVKRDSFVFDGRKYSLKSLVNKNIVSFDTYDHQADSLLKSKVRFWLKNDKRDSVKHVMSEFLKIAESHHLAGNLTVDQWFKLTYNAPEFTNYKTVGKKRFRDPYYNGEYDSYYGTTNDEATIAVDEVATDAQIMADTAAAAASVAADSTNYVTYNSVAIAIDTTSERLVTTGDQTQIEAKYYVPMDPLLNSYTKIVKAWERPDLDIDFVFTMLYVALFMSLAVFSFRITSGKSWLIALIVFGVTNFVIGIFTLLGSSEEVYILLSSLIAFCLLIYFVLVIRNKKSKEISGVTLNISLWTLPAILPILWYYATKIVREVTGYNDYVQVGEIRKEFPAVDFMSEHDITMIFFNILFVILLMIVMCNRIKKWKGIAED